MKKIIIALFALLSLTQLNALPLDGITENKNLLKEIRGFLQESVEDIKTNYTIAGLLYTGEATLVKHNNTPNFSLIQHKGYITFHLQTNKNFDAFTLEVVADKNNDKNLDPHRTNIYNVFLKLFKGRNLVQEQLAGVIELANAAIVDEGNFYTNLAVNAIYRADKFYVLDTEPNTCGKQIDLNTFTFSSPYYETYTVVNHQPDCQDHNHCSCPRTTVIERKEFVPTKVSYSIETETCKRDKTCKCPEYIIPEKQN